LDFFFTPAWLPHSRTNLLANPGFETGNTAGWSAFGSPTLTAEGAQVHTGSFACR